MQFTMFRTILEGLSLDKIQQNSNKPKFCDNSHQLDEFVFSGLEINENERRAFKKNVNNSYAIHYLQKF